MDEDEFDAFYEDTFLDAAGNRLARSWLFGKARDLSGISCSAEEGAKGMRTAQRRSMSDRDRVVCWLEMLGRDTPFEDMALNYGRCAEMYREEFRDMTAAARSMPCRWVLVQPRRVRACRGLMFRGGDTLISLGCAPLPVRKNNAARCWTWYWMVWIRQIGVSLPRKRKLFSLLFSPQPQKAPQYTTARCTGTYVRLPDMFL